MAIQIQSYLPEDEPAVKAFNGRLRAGGIAEFRFPETYLSTWLPPTSGRRLGEEFFLAKEGAEVRGGYVLKHQPFWISDREVSLGSLYLPLSEGLVDRRYSPVGLHLLRNALQRQPLLYCLGMGGFQNPLPLMLQASGWQLCAVPFFFSVANPRAFLTNIAFLRRRPGWRVLLDFLTATGLGSAGIHLLNRIKRRAPAGTCVTVQAVTEFGGWVDEIWNRARADYSLAAVRDAEALRQLYPAHKEKYLKLQVHNSGRTVGWAVLLDTQMSGHKYFGHLRLGSVIDCLALPAEREAVAWAATTCLLDRQVDLMVTNQSQAGWGAAFRRCGWLSGPSNFIFAGSPKLIQMLGTFPIARHRMHFNRGDGEGPTHL